MKQLITLSVLMLTFQLAYFNIGISQNKADEIYQLLEKYNEYNQFNGSVLVAKNGKVVHKGGNGYANMEWDIKNTSDTKHRLGSITKQFTAMLIMQLVEDGKLDLDKPISTYIPAYSPETAEKITLHHLLTHTSGIPNYTSFPGFFREQSMDPYTPEEFLQVFADSTLSFEPGSKYSYSNSGYFLLGYIIETVTGNTYEEELHSRIFKPLGMKNSGFDHHSDILKKRATGYEKRGNEIVNSNYLDMSIPYAAGSLYSTAEDLFIWDQALYTDKLISPELKTKMFTNHVEDLGRNYGYGWELSEMDGEKMIGHGGGINGFNTLISRFPESKDVVILLNNTGRASLGEITRSIRNILYDRPVEMPKKSLAQEIATLIESQGIEEAISYGKSMKDSKDYYLDEGEVNALGYEFLQNGNIDHAVEIFKLNTTFAPDSWNVWDSYAEGLVAQGNKDEGIKFYKKSIEMNPANANGIDMLKKLGVEVEGLTKEVKVDDAILASYVGKYELQPGFVIEITKEGSQLMGQATGQGKNEIFAKSDSEFYLKVVDAQIVFNKASTGEIESLTLIQNGRKMPAKKIE